MKSIIACALLMVTVGVAGIAIAKDEPRTLIQNTAMFDGESSELLLDHDVLVDGNLIAAVGQGLEADGATVIDGSG